MTRETLRDKLFEAIWRCGFAPHEDPAIVEKMKAEWPADVAAAYRRADACLSVLSALVQDEATVERVARALCSNPDQIIYRREGPDVFEPLGPRWLVEHAEDARAALSALANKDTQP